MHVLIGILEVAAAGLLIATGCAAWPTPNKTEALLRFTLAALVMLLVLQPIIVK